MLIGTASFIMGLVIGLVMFSILSANRCNCDEYTELLESALSDERKKHEDDVARVKKYHMIVVGERDNMIYKLRQRNAELELRLVNSTGRTADGVQVEVEVAHV